MNEAFLSLIYGYFKAKYDAAEAQVRYYEAVGVYERELMKAEMYKEVYNEVTFQIDLCAKAAKNND